MAQITENTKAAMQGTLAGLLSALKGAGLSNGVGGDTPGFSSLLSEIGTALTAKADDFALSQDTRRPAVVNDKNVLQAQEETEEEAPAVTDETTEETAVRQAGSEPRKQVKKEVDDEVAVVSGSDDVTVSADTEEVEPADTDEAPVAECLCINGEQLSQEDLQDMDEEDLMALLAALVPLDVPAPLTGQAVQGLKNVQTDVVETLDLTDETVQQALMQSLQRLKDLQDQISQTPVGKGEGDEQSLSENLTDLLADIADEISAMKELIAQSSAEQADAIEATVTQNVAQAEETLSSILSNLTAMTETELTKATALTGKNAIADKLAQDNKAQAMTNDMALAAAAQGAMSAGTPASAPSNISGEGSGAGLAIQATGATATQTLYAVASGSRTANSYDLANQLTSTNSHITTNVSSSQLVEQVSVQLRRAVKEGVDEISIQLRPDELGKIDIKLEFTSDNVVKGTIIAENQATLTLLQNDAASLQKILQDAGLQADSGCLNFSLKDGNDQSRYAQDNSPSSSYPSGDEAETALSEQAAATQGETYYVMPGRVNIHV